MEVETATTISIPTKSMIMELIIANPEPKKICSIELR